MYDRGYLSEVRAGWRRTSAKPLPTPPAAGTQEAHEVEQHARVGSTRRLGGVLYVVRIFPNAESCLRLVRALTIEPRPLEDHRYLNVDLSKEHKKEALRQAA